MIIKLILIILSIEMCSTWVSLYRRNERPRCPVVKAFKNLNLRDMMGFWYVVQYYASSEELPEYGCMQSNFIFDENDKHVTMNFTYIYAEDPFRELLQGNITWKIPNFDVPAHWIHAEDTYEGIYNTYIIDTDYKSWALLMHCAEKSITNYGLELEDQQRSDIYLSAFILAREPSLGLNVINFLREKLPQYDIDTSFMFPIDQQTCSNDGDDIINNKKDPLAYTIQGRKNQKKSLVIIPSKD